MGAGWWRLALVSPDGVAPIRMVSVSASVNLPLHHKVQKLSSGTGLPRWSRKNGRKTIVVVVIILDIDWLSSSSNIVNQIAILTCRSLIVCTPYECLYYNNHHRYYCFLQCFDIVGWMTGRTSYDRAS